MKRATKKTRIGVIGGGFIVQAAHLPAIRRRRDVEVAGLSTLDAGQAKFIERHFAVPTSVTDGSDLLADDSIDAYLIAVPLQHTAPVGLRALRAGKPVLLEKPMAFRSGDAKKLVAMAKRKKTLLHVAYMKRCDPGVRTLRALIEDRAFGKRVGRILSVEIHNFVGDWVAGFDRNIYIPPARKEYVRAKPEWVPSFVRPKDRLHFFCSFANFSHDLNLMRFLFAEPHRIAAARLRPSENPFTVNATVIFDYGTYDATLRTGCAATRHWDEAVTIHFERGRASLALPPPVARNFESRLVVEDATEGPRLVSVPWGWAFAEQIAHFVACVRGEADCVSDATDAAKDVIWAEKIYRAACRKEARDG